MRAGLVNPGKHIRVLASRLREFEQIIPPSWAPFVKTGVHKQRPPTQDDWWYIRSASILRKIAILGPVGTQKLRKCYGGRKNRGHKPDAFRVGSGNIIRTILQQLEKAGLIKQDTVHGHKGRVITPKGHSLLDKSAYEVIK